MAINTWAIRRATRRSSRSVCHSVQGTAEELAHDLDLDVNTLKYRVGGINHMAFFLELEERRADGSTRDLYPDLHRAYAEGRAPKPNRMQPRCENRVRYEMLNRLGYFVTESSEHFSEYVPYFIKDGRPDLIEKFQVPLDEYPKRCIEQVSVECAGAGLPRCRDHRGRSCREYACDVGYVDRRRGGDLRQHPQRRLSQPARGLHDRSPLSRRCQRRPAGNHRRPAQATRRPIRTNISVQEMTVEERMANREHIYHAAMTHGGELDLDQIWALTDALIAGRGMAVDWCHGPRPSQPDEGSLTAATVGCDRQPKLLGSMLSPVLPLGNLMPFFRADAILGVVVLGKGSNPDPVELLRRGGATCTRPRRCPTHGSSVHPPPGRCPRCRHAGPPMRVSLAEASQALPGGVTKVADPRRFRPCTAGDTAGTRLRQPRGCPRLLGIGLAPGA